ncbi:MAG: ATP-binding protein [Bdellovibrionota bacterium]
MNKKAELPYNLEAETPLTYYRLVLAIAGGVYLSWWFVVETLLPNSFNPFLSRFISALCLWLVFIATYYSPQVRKNIDFWFSFGAWAVTLHFYYLFYNNRFDLTWVWGSYLAVIAVAAMMQTIRSMTSYVIFVATLSSLLNYLSPNLSSVLFLSGIFTILAVSYVGLRSRIKLITQVRENTLQIRRLLDATFEGMTLHDGEFILDVNLAMTNMFGYSREELLGKSIYTMCTLESGQMAAANIAQQAESTYEAIGIRKDGSRFYIEIRGKKYMLKNGVLGRVAAIQDITDRKKNEQTKILFEASQEALRIKNEFISIASHELKTPLTSIKLQTQMTQMNADKNDPLAYSPERMVKFVKQIDRQANRLTNLIEDMLDVSRISLGKLSLDMQPTSLNFLIEETLESLADLIKQSGNEIICNLETDVTVNIDRFRMEQVITNLLTNAIKYGQGKPIKINITRQRSEVALSVCDQGMGIAKENQERIFARFERAVAAKNISGLGLGLYISQQIVQAHHGTIVVQSTPNEGACFIVNIPAD